MIALLQMRLKDRADWRILIPAIGYGIICLLQLQGFIQWSSANFVIGCLALPFMLSGQAAVRSSLRHGFAALAFAGLYFVLPVKTCQYVALVCALLFVFETIRGKTSILPFITLMLMSPIAQYFADAFSFSIRLWLTTVAGKAMLLFGRQVEVSGNVITHNGIDFSVDPACMGLHMLLSSLLCCLLIIAVQQKRWNRQLGVVWMTIVGCAAIVLNIISNLIRILLLVQFGIMPGTLLHELLGIFCMVLYVVVPAMIGLQWLVRRLGEEKPATAAPPRADPVSHFLHVLIGCLLLVGIVAARGKRFKLGASLPSVTGYRASYYDTEIIKLESDRSLVYLKPLKGFYVSEHHPMLCWTGGGYMFKKVAEKTIAGIPVISGTLEKGKEQLYTAWWYSSGSQHSSSGMGWRWEALRSGQPYIIVNVTAVNEQTLQEEMARVLRSETLRDWIAHSKR